jgi:hypothetical protein
MYAVAARGKGHRETRANTRRARQVFAGRRPYSDIVVDRKTARKLGQQFGSREYKRYDLRVAFGASR